MSAASDVWGGGVILTETALTSCGADSGFHVGVLQRGSLVSISRLQKFVGGADLGKIAFG